MVESGKEVGKEEISTSGQEQLDWEQRHRHHPGAFDWRSPALLAGLVGAGIGAWHRFAIVR